MFKKLLLPEARDVLYFYFIRLVLEWVPWVVVTPKIVKHYCLVPTDFEHKQENRLWNY